MVTDMRQADKEMGSARAPIVPEELDYALRLTLPTPSAPSDAHWMRCDQREASRVSLGRPTSVS